MNEPRDHLDMIFKSMEGFANGGKLDASELAEIIAIAERFYGDGNRYPEIAAASGIANPDLINVGQVITIP